MTATFAGGCFWCTEAVFGELAGVKSVSPGYAGGTVVNPSYEQVCDGATGHVEAIEIIFDETVISYEQLVNVFFVTHDPTTIDRQGGDVGSQYRSVIFYHDEKQKAVAERVKAKLEEDKVFSAPIVTQIVPFTTFYPAEDYHKNYFARNSDKPYCQAVISPKLAHFRKEFQFLLRN